ncbi:MAG: hypothetical protein ACLGPL_03970 [Acidobacteriota bacterium]
MNRKDYWLERGGLLLLSLGFFAVGIPFLVLGVTWLPVIGLFMGGVFVWLAVMPWTSMPFRRTVNIMIGSAPGRSVYSNSIVPVAILSTSRARGEAKDFDASTVDAGSIRLGPNGLRPIDNMSDPGVISQHLRDVDGDGDRDFLLYFHLSNTDGSDFREQLCLTGETVNGEIIKGCARPGEARL